MTPKQPDRRTFLKSGAVLAGLAVGPNRNIPDERKRGCRQGVCP